MKKKAAPKKKAAARKAAPKKAPAKKVSAKKPAPKAPLKKKTTLSRAHKRPAPPSSRPQPVPPGSEQPAQLADPNDQHGPMHIPSHKPAPAYANMTQRSWAGKPPRHNIPIPKR
jgi:hypothetical protein